MLRSLDSLTHFPKMVRSNKYKTRLAISKVKTTPPITASRGILQFPTQSLKQKKLRLKQKLDSFELHYQQRSQGCRCEIKWNFQLLFFFS